MEELDFFHMLKIFIAAGIYMLKEIVLKIKKVKQLLKFLKHTEILCKAKQNVGC